MAARTPAPESKLRMARRLLLETSRAAGKPARSSAKEAAVTSCVSPKTGILAVLAKPAYAEKKRPTPTPASRPPNSKLEQPVQAEIIEAVGHWW